MAATIQHELGKSSECIQTCRLLLQQPLQLEEKRRVLEMLGHAYRGQDQHYAAALCFAGLLPDLTNEQNIRSTE